jgi:hypothetical protein
LAAKWGEFLSLKLNLAALRVPSISLTQPPREGGMGFLLGELSYVMVFGGVVLNSL